ncbi:MAG: GNAT family N-acetyltransferase, partial [Nitrosopumilus sp.]|nr:GNAT family N-acetyltransferase [Nitrosopumilus sp.]
MEIYLKDITLDDSNFLYKLYILRDPKDVLKPIKKNQQEKFVKEFLKKDPSHPYNDWKLIKFEDKVIGSVTLNKKNNELGFWLMPEFQGKGIGPIAVKKLMVKNNKEYYTA